MSTHGTTPEHDDGPSLPGATYDKRPVRGDPAGWYPDPEARATLRYWAGRDWYEDADAASGTNSATTVLSDDTAIVS